jgi:hypothetical protein
MPHPKNRLKRTGDTHGPDVGAAYDDSDIADELITTTAQPEAALFDPAASGVPVDAAQQLAELPARPRLAGMQDEVMARPLAALAGAFVLGYVMARLTR